MTANDHILARLRHDYPGWDITQAGGQYLATRDRVLSNAEMLHGLRHVLTADTARQLRDALNDQNKRVIELRASKQPV
jgi:hypothetical protein